ncbi:adenosine 3'-phospho 5'-phosphosulfate transporter 1-like [Saccoglossus kowalevskii]|uniref:Adenosine 3'-phospho 5'-phosphosulfate transporter 1 n=1 Tax=Saccoglossus kowalevskii TaxID=10224 RepID=A0ABM0H0A3_SACKO|nr:PREDICTED: adenosine 3'-phospho 5'-phosphosulfate transporter 1-like [Saccoglossus kowalevskii]
MAAVRVVWLRAILGGLLLSSVVSGENAAQEISKQSTQEGGLSDYWVFRLFLNLAGYASIIIPAALVIKYIKNSNILEKGGLGHGIIYTMTKRCVYGDDEEKTSLEEGPNIIVPPKTKGKRALVLVICVAGLQGSYLTWGVLQERIMAHDYGTEENSARFKNSQFLVFMNRISALITAGIAMYLLKQPRHLAPMYKYSYSSLSNILSSWCQYEALKYVSFPTQVIAKASKIIPVMLMGKVISRKSYEYYEYLTAVMISVGVALFLLSQGEEGSGSTVTTVSGVIILVGYMTFDSFTSNWQSEIFKRYKVSSIQMMFGVNLFSVIFTSGSLLEQGGFFEALWFMTRYSLFTFHVSLLSLCSATGQLFIFYTIGEFGAVIFTIIMTTRQALAILLSCIIFSHPVTLIGMSGVGVVFMALLLRIYASSKAKNKKVPSPATKMTDVVTSKS